MTPTTAGHRNVSDMESEQGLQLDSFRRTATPGGEKRPQDSPQNRLIPVSRQVRNPLNIGRELRPSSCLGFNVCQRSGPNSYDVK